MATTAELWAVGFFWEELMGVRYLSGASVTLDPTRAA